MLRPIHPHPSAFHSAKIFFRPGKAKRSHPDPRPHALTPTSSPLSAKQSKFYFLFPLKCCSTTEPTIHLYSIDYRRKTSKKEAFEKFPFRFTFIFTKQGVKIWRTHSRALPLHRTRGQKPAQLDRPKRKCTARAGIAEVRNSTQPALQDDIGQPIDSPARPCSKNIKAKSR